MNLQIVTGGAHLMYTHTFFSFCVCLLLGTCRLRDQAAGGRSKGGACSDWLKGAAGDQRRGRI